MSDKKPSLIEIKSRHPGAITRGAITEVYVDGQRLRCVKKVELTITGPPLQRQPAWSCLSVSPLPRVAEPALRIPAQNQPLSALKARH